SYDFKIFGEAYLKWRHFLIPNNFIFARVSVKEGWANRETGKKGDPRLQYNSMQLLHDVMDNQAKKITIQMPVQSLRAEKINRLKKLLDNHKGEKQLHFTIYEMENQIKLSMPSRKKKVKISNELLRELDSQQFAYRLN
ncbi:MAG: hypothetical protein ACPG7E_03375, partial [Marinirhabdus sp.]